MDPELRLPQPILGKAMLQCREYAWPLEAVEEAVTAAREAGLACLGGQVQFRVPEGTCELYWLAADSDPRRPGEPWPAFVDRSAAEVLARFRDLRSNTDFVKEAAAFDILEQMQARGVDLSPFLCFVLYFVDERDG
jgi:hypothetical protein